MLQNVQTNDNGLMEALIYTLFVWQIILISGIAEECITFIHQK